jgi:hypothetical protein
VRSERRRPLVAPTPASQKRVLGDLFREIRADVVKGKLELVVDDEAAAWSATEVASA